jgi:hypothetical protein
LLEEGIRNITDYVDVLKSGEQEITDTFSAEVETESYALRASNAMQTLQRKLDLLTNSVRNALLADGSINAKCICTSKRCNIPFPIEQGLSLFSIVCVVFFFLSFLGCGETESTWYVGH